jgi:Putative zinc-finger
VSRRVGGPLPGADHARARDLAAGLLDEPIPPADAAWLDAHLATCDACRAAAAGYDLDRSALRALRAHSPEPPRDLWARTAAALEAERGRGARRPGPFGRSRRPDRWSRLGRVMAAPLAGLVVVVLVVSSGLLGGAAGPGASGSMATPIALTAAADLRVLTRASDGTVSLVSGEMKAVCPIGSESCGVAPSFAVTPVAGVTTTSDLGVVLSPTLDRIAVVSGQNGSQRVVIFPVVTGVLVASPAPSIHPSGTRGPTATPTVAATPTHAGGTATPSTPATTAPTASPATTPAGSPGASPTTPAGTAPVQTDGPSAPSASPSIAVSPVPGGAIQIASDVTVVGSVVYSPDGRQVAFAARPSDGATGPDIYVWSAGDATAHALTSDHATQLAGWTAAGILAGRVVDGNPSTVLLDPATGSATDLGRAWMPVVNPAGSAAAWWDGSVKLAADGITWVPDAGRLVLGAWPPVSVSAAPSDPASPGASAPASAAAAASPTSVAVPSATTAPTSNAVSTTPASADPTAGTGLQVIAVGPIDSWEVRWDQGATVVAVWLHEGAPDKPGRLSLYPIDPVTGAATLARPLLDGAGAAQGISLRTGRLVWSGPGASGRDAVQVLAWNGTEVGRLELPAGQGATVVP